MKIAHFLLGFFLFQFIILPQVKSQSENGSVISGHRGGVKTIEKSASIEGIPSQDEWQTAMRKIAIYHTVGDSIDAVKDSKLSMKANAVLGIGNDQNGRSVTPIVSNGIGGTTMNYLTPPDNAMAVANGGRVVAVDNEDISYFTTSGSVLGSTTHNSFFSGMSSSLLFDPRIIYDSEQDRFIYVLLHGSNSSVSKIFVCFSKSNNPYNDGWEIYEFPGNPLGDNSWTDYPNIGINKDELFLSVNLFSNGSVFNQVVVFQIDKMAGYNGQTLNYETWDNISDGNGSKAFTVMPASYGQQGTYGPNMYFMSSRAGGGSRVYLYEITNNLNSGTATMSSTQVNASYSVAADASQLGSSYLVDVGDCRMQSAFYLNGVVHCVHAGDIGSGYSGAFYYRIPVDNVSGVQSANIGLSGYDYAYPSIANFGLEECDKSVMIGFLRSGSSIYPELRVINCDNDMNWSNSTQVAAGNSPISFLGGLERWGDYSAIQRKHNANSPEVWIAGCHTNSGNRYQTRVAKVTGAYEPAVGPTVSFSASDSSGSPQFFVTFYDQSTGNPISWNWEFEGGAPATSPQQNPFVTYFDTGTFDVKLIATNNQCTDSITMEDFIHVFNPVADTDTVTLGTGFTIYVVGDDTFQLWDGNFVPLGSDDIVDRENRVYPNPIAGSEMIYADLDLPVGDFLIATVYDLQGQVVKILFQDNVKAGKHQLSFNKLALASGQYVLQIKSESKIYINEKIIVQR
jgi:PKD repeat protein